MVETWSNVSLLRSRVKQMSQNYHIRSIPTALDLTILYLSRKSDMIKLFKLFTKRRMLIVIHFSDENRLKLQEARQMVEKQAMS